MFLASKIPYVMTNDAKKEEDKQNGEKQPSTSYSYVVQLAPHTSSYCRYNLALSETTQMSNDAGS